jgi:hypothetical protein
MNTSGHGNDWLMMTWPLGVTVIVAVYVAGGPTHALEFVNDVVRTTVYHLDAFVRALL